MKWLLNSLPILSVLILCIGVVAASEPKPTSSAEASTQLSTLTSPPSVEDSGSKVSNKEKDGVEHSYDYQDFQKASGSGKFQIFTSAMVKAKDGDELALGFIHRLVYNTKHNVEIIEPILKNENYHEVFALAFENQIKNQTQSDEISILIPFIEGAKKFIVENRRFALSPRLAKFVLSIIRKTYETHEDFWNYLIRTLFQDIGTHYFSGKEDDKARKVGVQMVTYLMSRPEVDSTMVCQVLKNNVPLNRQLRLTLYRFISKDELDYAFGSLTSVKYSPEFRKKLGESPLVPKDREGAIKQYFSKPEEEEGEILKAISVHLGIRGVK